MSYFEDESNSDESRQEFQIWFTDAVLGREFTCRVPNVDNMMIHATGSIACDLASKISLGVVYDIRSWFNQLSIRDVDTILDMCQNIQQIGKIDDSVMCDIHAMRDIIMLLLMLEDYFITASSEKEYSEEFLEHILVFIYMINSFLNTTEEELTFFPNTIVTDNEN